MFVDLIVGEKRKRLEKADHQVVLSIQEELVHCEGRRHLRVEVDGPTLGLAELGPIGLHEQRRGQSRGITTGHLAHQFGAHGDVAPLVRTTELQRAVMGLVEVQKVVRLQEHVRELGVRNADIGAIETALDRVLGNHLINREVLTGIAKKVSQRNRRKPISIVQEQRLALAGRRREIKELLQLRTYTGHVLLENIHC